MSDRFPSDREIHAHIGARLRRMRAHRGLSQEQVAHWLGIGHQQISKYEDGGTRIPPARMIRLAAALGVPIDDFFLGLPGAESLADANVRALRMMRGYIARWGLDHEDPAARAEARECLEIGGQDESEG